MSLRSFVTELVGALEGHGAWGCGKLISLPALCSTEFVVEILTPWLEEDQVA